MPRAFPPIEPVKVRGAFAQATGPLRERDDQAIDLVIDQTAAFAAVIRGMVHPRSGRAAADMVKDIAVRMFRERTSSMLDDLAEHWWKAEHGHDSGARIRPFSALPIADRAELRARVKKLLVDRVPDALGDQAVLEAERRRLLDLPQVALRRANGELERRIERDRAWLGSGAAAMCAIFAAGDVSIAHLGDCRALRLRAGRAEVMTREHTLRHDYEDAGRDAAEANPPDVITRAIGLRADAPQLVTSAVARGDVYVLMTHGMTEAFETPDIVKELRQYGLEAPTRLVKRADSPENVAAVAVEIL
jgi:hypothetical protein